MRKSVILQQYNLTWTVAASTLSLIAPDYSPSSPFLYSTGAHPDLQKIGPGDVKTYFFAVLIFIHFSSLNYAIPGSDTNHSLYWEDTGA